MDLEERALLLPYYEDYDQHYSAPRQIRSLPRYASYEESREVHIDDPIWGEIEIGNRAGDEIFAELYTNPLVQRMSGIEQLTLPKHFATMPGSTEMTRWETAWGSVAFVRKMVEKAEALGSEFDDREVLAMQLRTFVSDLGHTAFSHLGDWLFQGFGGTEDQHDEELSQILEDGGVSDILQRHGFEVAEVAFPDVSDWIECKSPDLCVDRIDYGAREVARWVTGYESPEAWLERFELDEEHGIVMDSKQSAMYFATSFALLATEHWGHPVHRLQLQLFGDLVRGVIVDQGSLPISRFHEIKHPRDLMYAVDGDILAASRAIGSEADSDLNYDLHSVMLDIARAQRKIFALGRGTELERFIERYRPGSYQFKDEVAFPHPLEARCWTSKYTGVKPNNLQFIPAVQQEDIPDFNTLPHGFDTYLPPLKPRWVDPLYYDRKDTKEPVKRLSEHSEEFANLISEQKVIQQEGYVARLFAAPDFVSHLRQNIHNVQKLWTQALNTERATQEQKRGLLCDVGALAIATSSADIRLYS